MSVNVLSVAYSWSNVSCVLLCIIMHALFVRRWSDVGQIAWYWYATWTINNSEILTTTLWNLRRPVSIATCKRCSCMTCDSFALFMLHYFISTKTIVLRNTMTSWCASSKTHLLALLPANSRIIIVTSISLAGWIDRLYIVAPWWNIVSQQLLRERHESWMLFDFELSF